MLITWFIVQRLRGFRQKFVKDRLPSVGSNFAAAGLTLAVLVIARGRNLQAIPVFYFAIVTGLGLYSPTTSCICSDQY